MPASVMRPFVALAALLWSAAPGHAAPSSGDVTLVPKLHTGLCFDVQGGAKKEGAAVQLWQCSGTPGQSWRLVDGAVKVYGNMCLSVTDGIDRDGTGLQVVRCKTPNGNQRFEQVGEQLRWVGHDRCVDVSRGRRKNGTRLGIWTCGKNNDNQLFVAQPSSERSASADDAEQNVADVAAEDVADFAAEDVATDLAAEATEVAEVAADVTKDLATADDVAVWETNDDGGAASTEAADAVAADASPVAEDGASSDIASSDDAVATEPAAEAVDPVEPVEPVAPVVAAPEATQAPDAVVPRAAATKAKPASVTSSKAAARKLQSAGTFFGVRHISLASFLNKHPVLKPLRQDLIDAAKSVQPPLPPVLLAAIAMEESSGNPDVAGGLMQFTSAPTWAAYGHGDVNDGRDSLFATARYLHELLRQEDDDLAAALRAYNGDANGNYVAEVTSWLSGGSPYGEES